MQTPLNHRLNCRNAQFAVWRNHHQPHSTHENKKGFSLSFRWLVFKDSCKQTMQTENGRTHQWWDDWTSNTIWPRISHRSFQPKGKYLHCKPSDDDSRLLLLLHRHDLTNAEGHFLVKCEKTEKLSRNHSCFLGGWIPVLFLCGQTRKWNVCVYIRLPFTTNVLSVIRNETMHKKHKYQCPHKF